jgi:hypothetical protein
LALAASRSFFDASTAARASLSFFVRSLPFYFCSSVADLQFFAVVKTTVEIPKKIREKAMMTMTRTLPTKVMVPSYHSK